MNRIQIFIETVRHAHIAAPSLELMLLLAILTLSLVFRATRTGLLFAYLFSYRWGWMFISETLAKKDTVYLQAYGFLGLFVLVLGIIGMMRSDS